MQHVCGRRGILTDIRIARRIAIKFDTPRACVPSRTLMAQATAVPAALLSATEMDILVGLRFDVLNGSMVSRE